MRSPVLGEIGPLLAAAPPDGDSWLVWGIIGGALLYLAVALWLLRARLTGSVLVVVAAVVACSLYANLSFLVTNPADYRYFPPFQRGQNQNRSDNLGAEYYSIARALALGRGYADPFRAHTGPTAWMPPVLPVIEAALCWTAEDDKHVVTAIVVVLQDLTLIGTGLLVLALARQTTGRTGLAAALYVGGLLFYFKHTFQNTHDCWLVLAVLDLLIAGLVWLQPLASSWRRAAGWGAFGGLCALTSPVAGFVWGVLALAEGWRRGRHGRLALAMLVAGLTLAPWVVRNYLVLGRFIPVKSNLAFELYQSQCVQAGGVLQHPIFNGHPNSGGNPEFHEYQRLGEMAYMDRKWEQFSQSVRANPLDFVERVANRFQAIHLVYSPFNPKDEDRHPWMHGLARLLYPLPFVCLLGLLLTAPCRPLTLAEGVVIAVYLAYLLPYVLVGYYDRYKPPMIGAEVALLVWGVDRLRTCWRPASAEATVEVTASCPRGSPVKRRPPKTESVYPAAAPKK